MSFNTKRLLLINVASGVNGKDSQAPSSLDHVFASEHLKFREFALNVEVEVGGWANKTADKKRDWINKFSDKSVLYGEICDSGARVGNK